MKYLPSVASAALSIDIIAVPADPEKPEINSMEVNLWRRKQYCSTISDLDERRMEQYIPIDGCPQTGRLALMRNRKNATSFMIILYTSTLFSFIRSLSFLNLSVVLTVSISAARFVEIDSGFLRNLLVKEGCEVFLKMNLN